MAVPLVMCGPEQDGTQEYSEPNSISTRRLCPDQLSTAAVKLHVSTRVLGQVDSMFS